VKKSASEIGMPSSTFFSELTDGTDLVLLDQRDGAVGDAHALGQLALAEAFGLRTSCRRSADVHHHGFLSGPVAKVLQDTLHPCMGTGQTAGNFA
jgi:hypothetical protein